MRKVTAIAGAVIIAMLFSTTGAFAADNGYGKKAVEALNAQVLTLENEVQTLTTKLTADDNIIAQQKATIDAQQTQITQEQATIDALKQTTTQQQATINTQQQTIDTQKAQVDNEPQAIADAKQQAVNDFIKSMPHLDVHVVDEVTGQPIQGLPVYAFIEGQSTPTYTTDAQGRVTIPVTYGSRYGIEVVGDWNRNYYTNMTNNNYVLQKDNPNAIGTIVIKMQHIR